MLLLAVETSTDETAVALLDLEKFDRVSAGRDALIGQMISSQASKHAAYGGVVPELAARMHIVNLPQIIDQLFRDAGVGPDQIAACAVTRGPGLKGALLVGFHFAHAFAWSRNIPCVPVNHLEGHLWANELSMRLGSEARFLSLLVSGGHSMLVSVERLRQYRVVARTRDDAAGEAFDKVATLLDLPYPGGPPLSRLAIDGDPRRFRFTVGMPNDSTSFSFSGLKTAALRLREQLMTEGVWDQEAVRRDFAASVEQTIVDTLLMKSLTAVEAIRPERFILTGGVAANSTLRRCFSEALQPKGIQLLVPPPEFCTDNAAMIAIAGAMTLGHFGRDYFLSLPRGDVLPRWPVDELVRSGEHPV